MGYANDRWVLAFGKAARRHCTRYIRNGTTSAYLHLYDPELRERTIYDGIAADTAPQERRPCHSPDGAVRSPFSFHSHSNRRL